MISTIAQGAIPLLPTDIPDLKTQIVTTSPFGDQRPGTAGLRKKVSIFQQKHYLENLIQAIFNSAGNFRGKTIVAGGDGRYYNTVALQTLAEMSAANGVRKIIVGRNGLLSTPAASNLIRHRVAFGGFLLTASHNPGGPDGDFGIKFNTSTGGQASEVLTDRLYEATQKLEHYSILDIGRVDLNRLGERDYGPLLVEVVDPVADYADLMETLFDFDSIRDLFANGFRMRFDAMHAVTGPYALEIIEKRLGAPAGTVVNGVPLSDFGGLHPDPNPVDAVSLVRHMASGSAPDFAAASDGDGDRNMILGRGFVVSPGDSLAVMAAHAGKIPGYREGLAGVARSMPTSRAIDKVADHLGIRCYETPTGWRFFCNLLESGMIDLCGEESFGTSSSHAREKDGLWAVLFWLNLQAATGKNVGEIVHDHWRQFGRHAYCRNDYFISDGEKAASVMARLEKQLESMSGKSLGDLTIERADSFTYVDPVDGSESRRQGIRVFFVDGSRIIYRLSGTGTSGATLRVYLETYLEQPARLVEEAATCTASLAAASRDIACIEEITGLSGPTGVV
jgi:phosphoglucomutase